MDKDTFARFIIWMLTKKYYIPTLTPAIDSSVLYFNINNKLLHSNKVINTDPLVINGFWDNIQQSVEGDVWKVPYDEIDRLLFLPYYPPEYSIEYIKRFNILFNFHTTLKFAWSIFNHSDEKLYFHDFLEQGIIDEKLFIYKSK